MEVPYPQGPPASFKSSIGSSLPSRGNSTSIHQHSWQDGEDGHSPSSVEVGGGIEAKQPTFTAGCGKDGRLPIAFGGQYENLAPKLSQDRVYQQH